MTRGTRSEYTPLAKPPKSPLRVAAFPGPAGQSLLPRSSDPSRVTIDRRTVSGVQVSEFAQWLASPDQPGEAAASRTRPITAYHGGATSRGRH